MDSQARKLAASLHAAPGMASVAVAGAGTRAVGWLLGVAGASRTVLDVQIPYASRAMIDYLGSEPAQFVSADTAKALARTAYFRAVNLRDGREPVVGLGCSATIATDRPKRGEHRCHVATHQANGGAVFSLTLDKGLRNRDGEDALVSALTMNALADAFGLEEQDRIPLGLSPNERVERESAVFGDALDALAAGHVGSVLADPDGAQTADARIENAVILAGSFNPLHTGHEKLARAASATLGGSPAVYELSITNVDKPQLALGEVRRRIGQFAGRAPILATRATTFYEKAKLAPGCAFAIGYDTLERLIAPRYYNGGESGMLSALLEMRNAGCKIAVGGRATPGGFKTLRDAAIPPSLADMFIEIPETAFREDVSSSGIRGAGGF